MEHRFHSLIKHSMTSVILMLPLIATLEPVSAQVRFVAPPVSAPGNREAGTSRNNGCATIAENQRLTLLIPETNIGFTTQALPSFFVYVPANNAEWVELRLYEADSGEEVYAGQVSLPLVAVAADYRYQSTILKLTVPEDDFALMLDPGKDYIWSVMLVCNADDRADDIIAAGTLQRTDTAYLQTLDPALRDQLANVEGVSTEVSLTVYGEAGIWHELLATLASLAASDPSTYTSDWNTLLEQQGLGAIANAPIVSREVVSLPLVSLPLK